MERIGLCAMVEQMQSYLGACATGSICGFLVLEV
jgi:hypothetical protein